ncbi:UNC-50 protein, putative [Plasmodium gallinaceum]|uniref:UNC-50 protein, putative n=1 Tax=Plasmodium gallinaceum TaxID=5849 RepID=A0A1J1GV33_PLAGA|nr:UNC-50 protein, putative [Plasmodium gallinaceum]CRG96349.1 UNC-50 protein, putative [Plasmodium gallinaceum]
MLPLHNNENKKKNEEIGIDFRKKNGYGIKNIGKIISSHKQFNKNVKKKISYDYIVILLNKANLDIKYNYAQIAYSLFCPSKLYKLFLYRKQNKNHYYRDDPCFFFIFLVNYLTIGYIYSINIISRKPNVINDNSKYALFTIRIFYPLLIFLLTGILITTLNYIYIFKCIKNRSIVGNEYNTVFESIKDLNREILFFFDINLNCSTTILISSFAVPYFFLPILTIKHFEILKKIVIIILNILDILGWMYYLYIYKIGMHVILCRNIKQNNYIYIFFFCFILIFFFYLTYNNLTFALFIYNFF